MIFCFDLEGPLSPQDNAYELMGSIPHGREIFAKISRYDDILALKKEDYEPGYTLALILPFLISHKIGAEDIREISERAKINKGAKKLISELKKDHRCYIISTSYEQHAHAIGKRVEISEKNIYCTEFPIDEYLQHDIDLEDTEKRILSLTDRGLEMFFNNFYKNLDEKIRKIIEKTTVRGGRHKTVAIYEILKKENAEMDDIVAIGDSITDFKMLKEVKEKGGISIVFNGNKYAIPHAEFAYAGTNLLPLASFIKAENKKEFIENWTGKGHFHYVNDNMGEIAAIHKKYRKIMRGEAGGLG
ncbi:MAG: HAD hydrolase family protein [Euryarchaeota archaeon]|nr:HAD hydrolase family protein [Euryarchaeota archaeon]